MEIESVLIAIFVIFTGAKIFGEIFERLGIPVIVGELIFGVILGSVAPQLLRPHIVYDVIAQLGVIILLFYVGLETPAESLLGVGYRAVTVAVLGIIFPFILGFGAALLFGYQTTVALFLAVAMVATSVGVTARVLADLNVIGLLESRIILGAAVADDILALIVLAVAGSVKKGVVSWEGIGLIVIEVLLFVGGLMLIGSRMVKRHGHYLSRLRINNAPLVVALIVCFGFSALAGLIGMAAIIGAFMAGVIFAGLGEGYELKRHTSPIYEVFVPFFFVIIGSKINLNALTDLKLLGLTVVVIVLAVVGKIGGGALATLGLGAKSMLRVGAGMVPRGEVGVIVAATGLASGAISTDIYTVVIVMSIATTIIAAPLLKLTFK